MHWPYDWHGTYKPDCIDGNPVQNWYKQSERGKSNEIYIATRFLPSSYGYCNLLLIGLGRAACPNQNGYDPGSANSWIQCIVCKEASLRLQNRQRSRQHRPILSKCRAPSPPYLRLSSDFCSLYPCTHQASTCHALTFAHITKAHLTDERHYVCTHQIM